MKKLLILILLCPYLSNAQKIRYESDQYIIYYPKAYVGDDDGLEPEEYKLVESMYDTIFSIGYKDYYLAIRTRLGNQRADLFYTKYGSVVCEQIPIDSITHFWQTGNAKYRRYFGSTQSGTCLELIHDQTSGETYFEEVDILETYVCRNLKTMKLAVFRQGKQLSGFIYDNTDVYDGKYSPHMIACEGEGGYTIYSDEGVKLTAEPVDGFSNNGFFYTNFWTRVWKDGKYGIINHSNGNVIPPTDFYAPFHSVEGSLGEQKELLANKDAKVNKYTYNMGGLSEWYCFPMSRKWPLKYYPLPKGAKVGLVDQANKEVLPFEYDELYSYHVVGSKDEDFVVGKLDGKWLMYKNGLNKPEELPIDAWVNYGDCVGDDDYYTDAFVFVGETLKILDINSLELKPISLKKGEIKSVQNAHGLFALFADDGSLLKPFSEQMIIDEFKYFYPLENDTGFVLMNPDGTRAYPEAVSHITPSYTKGMYLLHQGEKAGLFSVKDDKYIPLSKEFGEQYFALDGGYANIRLDIAYRIGDGDSLGVIDFRNNTLLAPIYEEVYWNCDYPKEKKYELSNTELISAVGYRGGFFYVHNGTYTELKKVKADYLLEIKAKGFLFSKKGKVFVINKETLKKEKDWDYGQGEGLATIVRDLRSKKGKYGLIDSTGQFIIEMKMKWISERDYGCDDDPYFEVSTIDEKVGMYNLKGELLLAPIYDDLLAVIGRRYDKIFTLRKGETEALIMVFPSEGRVEWLTDFELENVTYERAEDANVLYYLDGSKAKVDRAGKITRME